MGLAPNRKTSASATNSSLSLSLQRFFYYGGVAYAGMDRMIDATRLFSECLTLPAKTCSGVQLEAFKK
jgi:hypothetical protein